MARTLLQERVKEISKSILVYGKEIVNDLTNLSLLPLKIMWFLEMAGVVAIWPYNSLHMQQTGLDTGHISMIQSMSRIVGAISPIVTGFVADRCGHFKLYLAFVFLVEGMAGAGVLLIPPLGSPAETSADLLCHQENIDRQFTDLVNCSRLDPLAHHTPAQHYCPDNCTVGFLLQKTLCDADDCQPLSNTTNPTRQWPFVTESTTFLCVMRTQGVCSITCASHNESVAECSVKAENNNSSSKGNASSSSDSGQNVTNAGDTSTGSELEQAADDRLHRTLVWYTVLRMIYSYGLASSYTLTDALTLICCSRMGANYALQRVWGSLAAIGMSPLFGELVRLNSGAVTLNFSVAFYALVVARLVGIPVLYSMDLEYRKKKSLTIWKRAFGLLKNANFLVMLPIPIALGMSVGLLEAHVYVFLKKLGFGVTLIAGTISIGNTAELALLLLTGWATSQHQRRFHSAMILIGTLLAGFRFIGYQFLEQTWTLLLLEAMDGVTGGLLVPALMTSTAAMVPPEMIGTVRGMMGTILYGIAPVLGTLFSGFVIVRFGFRWSFGTMGWFLMVAAVWYGVAWVLCLRLVRDKYGGEQAKTVGTTDDSTSSIECAGPQRTAGESNGSTDLVTCL